jgi:UDP-N-acetyl-D-mannosaminuronate dehydrogenase
VKKKNKIVVVGLGEVGKPLLQLISRYHEVIGVDIAPPQEKISGVDVLHICYPFEISDFIGETVRYIAIFNPALTVINTTVGVGTTRAVAQSTGAAVVHSPVRGKHVRMLEELSHYVKFIGALDPAAGKAAAEHFESVGMKTRLLTSPEATEVAKLAETTYFGLMIAWAQEVERYCDKSGAHYDEVVAFYEEIKFFPPVKYTAGIIGGHCVMPNIKILSKFYDSMILKSIDASNQKKIERETRRSEVESATARRMLQHASNLQY